MSESMNERRVSRAKQNENKKGGIGGMERDAAGRLGQRRLDIQCAAHQRIEWAGAFGPGSPGCGTGVGLGMGHTSR